MCPSEQMKQLIDELIKHYEAEVRPSGLLYLALTMDGYGVLVIEEKVKHKRMAVCYWLFDAQAHPVAEPLLLFCIDASGHWLPYELHGHTGGQQVHQVVADPHGALVATDPTGQEQLAAFADEWAEVLRKQGWIGGAEQAITQPGVWPDDEDESTQPPAVEDLWDWVDEYGLCTATDGCWVEMDGTCEHGHPSWLVVLGLI